MRPGRLRPTRMVLGLALSGCLVAASCGEDQDPWCGDLERWSGLETLSAAIEEGDGEAAEAELEGFDDMAGAAPEELRGDMQTVSTALADAVEVALDDGSTDPDDLELRREELNERLGRIAPELQRISAYAETECGLRLGT